MVEHEADLTPPASDVIDAMSTDGGAPLPWHAAPGLRDVTSAGSPRRCAPRTARSPRPPTRGAPARSPSASLGTMPDSLRLAVIPGDGIGPEVVAEGLKVLRAAVARRGRRRDHRVRPRCPPLARHRRDAARLPCWPRSGSTTRSCSARSAIPASRAACWSAGCCCACGSSWTTTSTSARRGCTRASPRRWPTPGEASTSSSSARAPRARTSATAARSAPARRTRSPPRSASTPPTASSASSATPSRRAAARPRRKHLPCVHKHNVLTHAGHLWRRTVERRATPSSRRSTTDYLHVDAATIFLVTDPSRFDVIVTDNLFGDILTDLAAAVAGGIGLAASGNINPDRTAPSMFEPVHGSAPDIAGQQKADPTATVLSVAMLLEHLGLDKAAERVEQAVAAGPGRASGGRAPDGARRRSATRLGRARIRLNVPTSCQTGDSRTPEPCPFTTTTPEPVAGQRRAARRDPRRPRVRHALHRPHGPAHLDPEAAAGTTPRLEPYGPITLDPAAAVLHYAQEIFEGLKAYRHADGSVWAFRPEANARPDGRAPPAGWRCRSCRSRTSSPRSRRWSRTDAGLGARRRRDRACTCGRSCSPRRCSSACGRRREVTYMLIASPVGPYFPRRGEAGVDLAVDGVHPGGARRHRRGQVRRQLRRQPGRRRSRPASTAATRSASSTRPSSAGSRSSAG